MRMHGFGRPEPPCHPPCHPPAHMHPCVRTFVAWGMARMRMRMRLPRALSPPPCHPPAQSWPLGKDPRSLRRPGAARGGGMQRAARQAGTDTGRRSGHRGSAAAATGAQQMREAKPPGRLQSPCSWRDARRAAAPATPARCCCCSAPAACVRAPCPPCNRSQKEGAPDARWLACLQAVLGRDARQALLPEHEVLQGARGALGGVSHRVGNGAHIARPKCARPPLAAAAAAAEAEAGAGAAGGLAVSGGGKGGRVAWQSRGGVG